VKSTYELGIAWAETIEATTPATRVMEYFMVKVRECE
jgi:hypothetical protein